jgi:uncharacterized membrane protein
MPRWLSYTLTATAIWGVWGLVSAVVAREVSPLETQVISTLGVVPAALLLFLSPRWKQGSNLKLGILLSALTSLSGTAGNLCMLRALSLNGPVSIVLPVSGMFPLVTALMAMVLLRERLNRVQILGFFLAAAAIYLSGQAPGASAMDALHGIRMETLATPWMFWTFTALVTYGVSAYLQKITTFYCSNELCTIVFALVWIPVAFAIYLLVPGLSFKLSGMGWVLSVLFGALIGIGSLVTFASYRWGKASVVTPIIGLYPALTVLLAVPVLKEPMGMVRAISVGLALAAGAALGCESDQPVRAVDGAQECAVGQQEG